MFVQQLRNDNYSRLVQVTEIYSHAVRIARYSTINEGHFQLWSER
jgi:NADP-dependent 3-hydroxy acid dehydrogenase YdfG